jgi:hypothetical protein
VNPSPSWDKQSCSAVIFPASEPFRNNDVTPCRVILFNPRIYRLNSLFIYFIWQWVEKFSLASIDWSVFFFLFLPLLSIPSKWMEWVSSLCPLSLLLSSSHVSLEKILSSF